MTFLKFASHSMGVGRSSNVGDCSGQLYFLFAARNHFYCFVFFFFLKSSAFLNHVNFDDIYQKQKNCSQHSEPCSQELI